MRSGGQRPIGTGNFKSGKISPAMNLLIGCRFLSVVPLPLRGWIVPVGDTIPDRRQTGSGETGAQDGGI